MILKTTPPRLLSGVVKRDLVHSFWTSARERSAIVLAAPAGFGKTTVLLQWRYQWMEHGARVAWLNVDAQDEPVRFALALLHALGNASGAVVFSTLAAQCENKAEQGMAILTALLGEVALLRTEIVLMLDDAERLPDVTLRTSLSYLLLNAPANLHVVIGSRAALPLPISEMVAKKSLAVLKAEELRFRLEESIDLLDRRLEGRLSVHESAKLHEAVQGWPIGLQFAISRLEYEDDLAAAINTFSAREGDLQDYFVDALLHDLTTAEADFLVQIAILDYLQAELCEAVTGRAEAGNLLNHFAKETPLIMAGPEDWVRLHPLARDFLLERLEHRPRTEQVELHARASRWFAGRERFHEAAHHALAAGDEAQAQAYAARSLWLLGAQGKLTEARQWLAFIPPRLLASDMSLKLVAAWVLALSGRSDEALRIAMKAAADPASTPLRRMIALRVAGGAAIYADRLGLVAELVARWPTATTVDDPLYVAAPLNGSAIVALHAGHSSKVRELAAQVLKHGETGSMRLASALARTMTGLSHLWEGSACQAEAVLQPALIKTEREEGRRSTIACNYAAVLAAAMLRRGQPDAAHALLADRLDVIEEGFPDIVLVAYDTLVRIALDKGDERRALAALDNLDSLAKRRQLPRLQLHCVSEQVRIHAMSRRNETVSTLVTNLDDLAPAFRRKAHLSFLEHYLLVASTAKAYAAFARNHLDEAERQLQCADALAHQLGRSYDMQVLKVLRALLAKQRGTTEAAALMSEAIDLARLGGNVRLLADAHPDATRVACELHLLSPDEQTTGPEAVEATSPSPASSSAPPPVQQGLLTAKEAEILHLLNKGMPNKLIARALGISSETVKWHLKNLFQKLSAGTRRHAVGRARLLGLVSE
ncbi:LuxR C-terminal-related transcriptional regulator [Dyella jiangningensis]|uniref:LuxR C-terminal-related transcriptional regulator n=1 Tax=Dyella jiangningensis TaxID=1379159 RepID=UPI001558CF15|nr:LuxR C-terminal-related transcriptional regulator [Dyella jiangningensis]